VDENSDRTNSGRYRFDNPPDGYRLKVAWTLRVKVKANHVGAEFGARPCVFNVGDATNLDLQWSHRWPIRAAASKHWRSSAPATKSRTAISGSGAHINASPTRKPRNPNA